MDDNAVQIAVMSGRVSAGHRSPVVLTAGAVATITDSTAVVTTGDNVGRYRDWTRGRLVFEDVPVAAVLAAVGQWYGYKFTLHDSVLASQKVSVTFDVSNVTDMMVKLKALLEVTMQFDGTTVLLTPRQEVRHTPISKRTFIPSKEMGK
jgi:ferric-dicitrate binding protein FerR (iron transport regulator)